MNRSEFIKNLVALFGVSVLPAKWVSQYEKIYLLQCFVRGFQFYKGIDSLERMNTGDMLELVREPNNEHDNSAIALHRNGEKIGFIPRESNEILSRLLDSGLVELHAEITHLEPAARTWENVHVAVYLLKKIGIPLPPDNQYLTRLETPEYLTLKWENGMISRINAQPEVTSRKHATLPGGLNEERYDWKEKKTGLKPNRKPFTIDPEKIASETVYVINRSRTAMSKKMEDLLIKIDDEILDLDEYFGEKGYVVANMDQLSLHTELVEDLVEISDERGNRLIEILVREEA